MIWLVIVSAMCGIAVGSSFSISPSQSVTIQPKTVEFAGDEHTISEIAYVAVDGQLTITTTGPSNGSYAVYLFNKDEQIVTVAGGKSGQAETTFDAEALGLEAGTYYVAIKADGELQAVKSVIVNGYNVSVDTPETGTVGEKVTITVDLYRKPGVDEQVHEVVLYLETGNESREITATRSGNGTYTTTFVPEQTGSYSVYVGVQGTETIDDEHELIAISSATSIEVAAATEEHSPTETAATDAGNEGGPSSKTTTMQGTPTPTADSVVTPAPGTSPAGETAQTGAVGLPTAIAGLVGILIIWRLGGGNQ